MHTTPVVKYTNSLSIGQYWQHYITLRQFPIISQTHTVSDGHRISVTDIDCLSLLTVWSILNVDSPANVEQAKDHLGELC